MSKTVVEGVTEITLYQAKCPCGWKSEQVFTSEGAHRLWLLHLSEFHPTKWRQIKKLTLKDQPWED